MTVERRRAAGRQLAAALREYAGGDAVVVGVTRGGMVVAAEERVYDIGSANPTMTSLVDQLVSAVHQETLHESRPAMQRVLDAEKAFEQ